MLPFSQYLCSLSRFSLIYRLAHSLSEDLRFFLLIEDDIYLYLLLKMGN